MSQTTPLERIAFIGGYGHHCLRGLLDDQTYADQLEALAVAGDGHDDDAARRKFAPLLESGRATWFDDPVRMLDTFKPTIVNVGGVYADNAPLTIEALEREIAVVSEKPIAATWEQLEAVRAATADEQRVLLTEFAMRSNPAFRAAHQAVRAGEIGEIVLATAQKSYRFGDARPAFYARRADYGSTLLWVASHAIDFTAFTTGHSFTAVSGAHNNLSRPDYGPEFEDHATALFKMDNGGTAVVHADFLRPNAAATHGDDRLRLAGDKGVLEVRAGRCLLTTADQPERDITDRAKPAGVQYELLEAVRQGGTTCYNTQASLQIAATLLAARDAADTQQWVQIAPSLASSNPR